MSKALEVDKKEEEQTVEIRNDLPRDTFGIEKVNLIWEEFLVRIKKQDIATFHALEEVKVRLKSDTEIELVFNSASHEMQFAEHKDVFVNQLKNGLNHFYIQVLSVVEHDKTVNHVKSKQDIYKEMLEKNPYLEEFRKGLDLDIDG